MNDWNLSDKIWNRNETPVVHEKDVREFIKRLKEEIDSIERFHWWLKPTHENEHVKAMLDLKAGIDKLAGEKLV